MANRDLLVTLELAATVAESIAEAGSEGLPAGPLYAAMCGVVTLEGFERLVGLLVNTGLVEKRGHVLYASALLRDKLGADRILER